jgi:hypothetical protein
MKEVLTMSKTEHRLITPSQPQSNGNVERACGTISRMLSHYLDEDYSNWDLILPKIVLSYNTTPQTSTKMSPFELVYGRQVRMPIDLKMGNEQNNKINRDYIRHLNEARELVKTHILREQEKQKENYDSSHREYSFKVGDKVAILNTRHDVNKSFRFERKYVGPFVVVKIHGKLTYSVKNLNKPKQIRRVHVRHMKAWHQDFNEEIDDKQSMIGKSKEEKSITTISEDRLSQEASVVSAQTKSSEEISHASKKDQEYGKIEKTRGRKKRKEKLLEKLP